MPKRIYFLIMIITVLFLSGCKLQGYKNLKSGNWGEDTTHVAFNNLPEDVINTYRNYYELNIYMENNKVYIKNNIVYGEDNKVHGVLSKGIGIEHTVREKIDTLIHYVSYVDAYTLGDGWARQGLYFKIGEKKFLMPYWELRIPLVLYDDILYFLTDIYVDIDSERKFKYKNYIGYSRKYYVAYKLKGLTNKMKGK